MQNHVEEHWKDMDISVGYIKENQKHELMIKKLIELRTVSYCDSSYGDFKDTRKITMGEVHTIGGDITSCKYQQQKTLMQLSTEAEYITLSEADRGQKFTQI